jgi:hypothetical protein
MVGMRNRRRRTRLQTPDRLDTRFGVVAGIYVAALLSPALVFVVAQALEMESELLALGLLGTVGSVITALVSWRVTHWGGLIEWFNTTFLAVLVPAIGVLPMVGYLFHLILFVAFFVSDLRAESTVPLVGFTGFVCGLLATCLGSALVLMARNRLAEANSKESDHDIEWTAGWPVRDRLGVVLGTLAIVAVVAGLSVWQLGLPGLYSLSVGGVLAQGISGLVSERTYRVTPAGLERRRENKLVVSRHLIQWKRLDGFSVTDDAIVLHRLLRLDYRCARSAIHADDDEIIAALSQHLDRRE